MALPILDGNQTSTTLATTVSGGAHYPNHIIASGTVTANVFARAVYDASDPQFWPIPVIGFDEGIEYATRGVVVPVQLTNNNGTIVNEVPISGTVTANVNGSIIGEGYNSLYDLINDGSLIVNSIANPVTIGSCVTHGVTVANSVTIASLPAISGTVTANGGVELGTTGNSYGFIAFGVDDVGAANSLLLDGEGRLRVKAEATTVTVGNSVTVSSLPVQFSTTTIGGTARLNVTLSSATTVGATAPSYANLYGGSDGTNLRAISVDSSGRTVVTGTTSILGTSAVTFGAVTGSVSILGTPSVTMGAISGTVTASVSSTTVTVSALPSGALTTRFGSVTTANTAQLTAAVTNSARRYLLAQNISAGTVTIGIGFSPTTTQGIQLSAGGGLSFDAFCPTGAVWWLSATTGANFTILEG